MSNGQTASYAILRPLPCKHMKKHVPPHLFQNYGVSQARIDKRLILRSRVRCRTEQTPVCIGEKLIRTQEPALGSLDQHHDSHNFCGCRDERDSPTPNAHIAPRHINVLCSRRGRGWVTQDLVRYHKANSVQQHAAEENDMSR